MISSVKTNPANATNVRSMRFTTKGGSCYVIRVADDPSNEQECMVRIEPFEVSDWSDGFEVLTRREKEIVDLVAKGYTNTQISHDLFISISTVKTHIKSVFEKLGVDNRTMLVHRFFDVTA